MAYGKKISVSLCLLVVFVGLVNGSKKEHKHHHVEKKPKQPHVDNQPQQPHDIEVKPKKEQVGIKPTNENVGFYELRTSNLYVKLTNWGASIATLSAPDKNGMFFLAPLILNFHFVSFLKTLYEAKFYHFFLLSFAGIWADIALGYDSVQEYMVRFWLLLFIISI